MKVGQSPDRRPAIFGGGRHIIWGNISPFRPEPIRPLTRSGRGATRRAFARANAERVKGSLRFGTKGRGISPGKEVSHRTKDVHVSKVPSTSRDLRIFGGSGEAPSHAKPRQGSAHFYERPPGIGNAFRASPDPLKNSRRRCLPPPKIALPSERAIGPPFYVLME